VKQDIKNVRKTRKISRRSFIFAIKKTKKHDSCNDRIVSTVVEWTRSAASGFETRDLRDGRWTTFVGSSVFSFRFRLKPVVEPGRYSTLVWKRTFFSFRTPCEAERVVHDCVSFRRKNERWSRANDPTRTWARAIVLIERSTRIDR